jgi:putative flippase GtrA
MLLRELFTAFRYGLVGLANTAFSTALMLVLSCIGFPYILYTAIAYVAGMFLSFILNYHITFRCAGVQVARRALKFALVSLSLLGMVQLLQFLLIEKVGIPEPVGVIAGMCFYTGSGYLINRLWVFSSSPERK